MLTVNGKVDQDLRHFTCLNWSPFQGAQTEHQACAGPGSNWAQWHHYNEQCSNTDFVTSASCFWATYKPKVGWILNSKPTFTRWFIVRTSDDTAKSPGDTDVVLMLPTTTCSMFTDGAGHLIQTFVQLVQVEVQCEKKRIKMRFMCGYLLEPVYGPLICFNTTATVHWCTSIDLRQMMSSITSVIQIQLAHYVQKQIRGFLTIPKPNQHDHILCWIAVNVVFIVNFLIYKTVDCM